MKLDLDQLSEQGNTVKSAVDRLTITGCCYASIFHPVMVSALSNNDLSNLFLFYIIYVD